MKCGISTEESPDAEVFLLSSLPLVEPRPLLSFQPTPHPVAPGESSPTAYTPSTVDMLQLEEAEEWRHEEYDTAVRETRIALEKASAATQECKNYETQSREAAPTAEFSTSALAEKEDGIKEQATKIEEAEQRLTALSLELKTAESKIKNYDLLTSTLKLVIKELVDNIESANATALSAESKARILEEEKIHLEQKYGALFNRFEEVQERCKAAEREAKRATELVDEARAGAASAQEEKSDFQRVAMERLMQIERAERHAETLEWQMADLTNGVERCRAAEEDALLKVEMLEEIVREKDEEIDSLLQSNNSQREETVQVLESLLQSGLSALSEANNRAEGLSAQLQVARGKFDELTQQLIALRFCQKRTLESKLRIASRAKRCRTDDNEGGLDSVHDAGSK